MQEFSFGKLAAFWRRLTLRNGMKGYLVAVDTGQPALHTHCQSHAQSM